MDKSELSEEITTLINKAEAGDATAQYNLGLKYRNGRGLEQNNELATMWYRKAADQGNPDAQTNLGWMYRNGLGVSQSDVEAAAWYEKAANQGHARAQTNLGWMYQNGLGVDKNYRTAVTLYREAVKKNFAPALCNLGWMYKNGKGVKQDYSEAISLYKRAVEQKHQQSQFNLGLMYFMGHGLEKDYSQAKDLFRQASTSTEPDLRFKAIEYQDKAERYILSPKITEIRIKLLNILKVNIKAIETMTHYTSLTVGNALLLEESSLRLGHINALNDPNEGKLLWRFLDCSPVESKPVFVGCFLPDDDSLNMWRFYSKDHQNDDACGCAITYNIADFFKFNLLKELSISQQQSEYEISFPNTGKSPQESATFYRIIYINDDMTIRGDDSSGTLRKAFYELKDAVREYLDNTLDNDKHLNISRLLGPLPYLLKDADYEAEKEHRMIITHLDYGDKEIQSMKPDLVNGVPPRLYLELHRQNHLAPVRHVTLGPKAPHQEMMIPYWHHKLMSDFADQLKSKKDFYIRASRCAYQ
ncbi:putative beta-lactamase HcpD precursor [compost metagenome]